MVAYLAVSIYAVFKYGGVLFGSIYIVIAISAFWMMTFAYCVKCPHAVPGQYCTHIWFEKIARLYPRREGTKHNFWEIMGLVYFLTIPNIFPQFFLWHDVNLGIAYWVFWFISYAIGNRSSEYQTWLAKKAMAASPSKS